MRLRDSQVVCFHVSNAYILKNLKSWGFSKSRICRETVSRHCRHAVSSSFCDKRQNACSQVSFLAWNQIYEWKYNSCDTNLSCLIAIHCMWWHLYVLYSQKRETFISVTKTDTTYSVQVYTRLYTSGVQNDVNMLWVDLTGTGMRLQTVELEFRTLGTDLIFITCLLIYTFCIQMWIFSMSVGRLELYWWFY